MAKENNTAFKSTPIGMIPKDWEILNVGEVGSLFKGKGIAKAEIVEEGLPCVRYGELYTKYNIKFTTTLSFCNEESALQSQEITKGDILFAGSGETVEDIGKCAVYFGDSAAYAGGDIIILRPEKADSIYLSYLLNYDSVVKQRSVLGQGNSVVHIYPKGIATILVQIPPQKEQTKIAQILSTWDESIETLENLILKKERNKKALMQKLLTGKKRFGEFKGEKWKEILVNDLCKIHYGKDHKIINDPKGKFPIIGTGGVMGFTNSFLCNNPSVIIGRKGTIDRPMYVETPFWTIDTAYYTEFSNNVHPKWFYYIFSQIQIHKYNEASGVPSLSRETLYKIKIKTPSFKEQKKITSVFSATDEEIQTLKTQLEHCKQQKKGLMQVLLTGKKRVKV